MKPTKFELMRKNRSKRGRKSSHFEHVRALVEKSFPPDPRLANQMNLGCLGLHNSMSDPLFYSPAGKDLYQQNNLGRIQFGLNPSKETPQRDLGATVDKPNVNVFGLPSGYSRVWGSAIRGLSMRIRKLAEKFSQFLR